MGVQKCCGQESCTENDLPPPKNDRRCQLINEIKQMIGDIEHEEKSKPRQSRRPDKGVPGMRDLEDECRMWRKRRECSPPTITAIALHETRPTSDYSNMRHENSSQRTYVDATKEGQDWRKTPPAPWELPRTPSQELRAGTLYQNCQCLKRNGLQHDCPRWECGGRPECVAVNPGPCCVPSQGLKPIRGDRRYGNKPQEEKSVGGSPGFGGKQLKTGPLNPEICIPIGAAKQPQGVPEGAGQGPIGFIAGVKIPPQHINQVHQPTQTNQQPHHDVVMVLDLSQVSPGNQGRQPPQTPQSRGGAPPGAAVSCYCKPVQTASSAGSPGGFQGSQLPQTPQSQGPSYGGTPGTGVSCYCKPVQISTAAGSPEGFQSRGQPQNQVPTQEIMLTGPGMTCCCRPVQSAPPSGGPGMVGIIGIPMAVAPLRGK